MVQVQDGNIETVYPTASKSADIIFPMNWNKLNNVQTPGFESYLFLTGFLIFDLLKLFIVR